MVYKFLCWTVLFKRKYSHLFLKQYNFILEPLSVIVLYGMETVKSYQKSV